MKTKKVKETSLALQLRKLQTPQTDAFIERKIRASFLYDTREATSIDKDTHYSIALNAFKYIVSIDSSLNEFGNSLFSLSSRDLDRGLLSSKANAKLNNTIRKFLYKVVTPFFLLNCTHKMLEWLIYKYQIHEYNMDDLLISVLPYHETRLFVRVVQLCSKVREQTNFWHWLINIQKNGIPLIRTDLANHCISHSHIIQTFQQVIVDSCNEDFDSPTLISFFTSLLINLLDRSSDFEIVQFVISHIIFSIKSLKKPLVASAYIILATLCTKISVKKSSLRKVLKKVSKYHKKSPQLQKQYLYCIESVYKSQRINFMDDDTMQVLSALMDELYTLYQCSSSSVLISAFLVKLITYIDQEVCYSDAIKVLKFIKPDKYIISSCLSAMTGICKSDDFESKKENLANIAQTIERQFPTEFDEAINLIDGQGLKNLLTTCLYAKSDENYISIWKALIHPNNKKRLLASEHLVKNFHKLLEPGNERLKNLIGTTLTNTWTESDPCVLIQLFQGKDLFNQIISNSELFEFCKKLLKRCKEMISLTCESGNSATFNDWCKVQQLVVELSLTIIKTNEMFISIFIDSFLPLKDCDLLIINDLFSNHSTSIDLLSRLQTECNPEIRRMIKTKKISAVIDLLSSSISKALTSDQVLYNLLNSVTKDSSYYREVLILCILYHHLANEQENFSLFVRKVISLCRKHWDSKRKLKKANKNIQTIEELFSCCGDKFKNEECSGELLFLLISQIINLTDFSCTNKYDEWYWCKQNVEENFLYVLFNFICDACDSKKSKNLYDLFRPLFIKFCKRIRSSFPSFITSCWSRINEPFMQFRTLAIGSKIFSNYNFTEIDIISLLISLRSLDKNVRLYGSKMLMNSKSSIGNSLLNHLKNSAELFESSEDIICEKLSDFFKTHIECNEDWVTKMNGYILSTNVPTKIRDCLISLLASYNTYDDFKIILPTVKNILKSNCDSHLCDLLCSKLLNALISMETINEEIMDVFRKFLNIKDFSKGICDKMSSNFIESFENDSVRTMTLDIILDMILDKRDQILWRKMKKFVGNGSIVVSLIDELTFNENEIDEKNSSKRFKSLMTKQRIDLELDDKRWMKVMLLLEILITRKSIKQNQVLMKELFILLKHSFIYEEKSSIEYFRLLLLEGIRLCLEQEKGCDQLDGFEVSFIFETLKQSGFSETSRSAVKILNMVSNQFKEEILSNLISIFGFIGDNIIKCNDNYTINILDDTMNCIIKQMVCEGQGLNEIIQLFIDFYNDIPPHRRLYLFHKLALVLDPKQNLWHITFKLCETMMKKTQKTEKKDKPDKEDYEKIDNDDFVRALVVSFDGITQITTLDSLINEIEQIIFNNKWKSNNISFTLEKRKSISDYMLKVIINIIISSEFLSKVVEVEWNEIESAFRSLMEKLLNLISELNKKNGMKILLLDCLKILEKINDILPLKEFTDVLHSLLKSENPNVQRKAMDALNDRLIQESPSKLEFSLFQDFLDPLINIIELLEKKPNEVQVTNSVTAMFSLKLLASKFSKTSNEEWTQDLLKAINLIISLLEKKEHPNLLASSLLCVTELSMRIGHECLPHLPILVRSVIDNLDSSDEIVRSGAILALAKFISKFANFLSPYLEEIVKKICLLDRNKMDQNTITKLATIEKKVATLISFRILINVLKDVYVIVSKKSTESLLTLYSLLIQSLDHCDKISIEENITSIQSIALNGLSFRCENSDHNDIDKIESKCIQMISVFVLKLTEDSFRTFFLKVYDWAILSPQNSQSVLKCITFYKLTNNLCDTLKTLFSTLAAPYLVNNALKQLIIYSPNNTDGEEAINEKNKTNSEYDNVNDINKHLILLNVLSTLSKCCLYDVDRVFSTKQRISKLILPIIDQIKNDFGSDEYYQERINEGVLMFIKGMIKVVPDHHLRKDLNYNILLNTRENKLKVRYQALHLLHELILLMTDEFMPLLPEAIPFLAELHEDDSDEIQKLLLVTFSDIEKIFGEPISTYF